MGRKTWNFPSLWLRRLHNIIYQLSPEHNLISQDSRLELVGSRDWGSLGTYACLCVCSGNLNFSSRISPIVLRYKPAGNFKLRKKSELRLEKVENFPRVFLSCSSATTHISPQLTASIRRVEGGNISSFLTQEAAPTLPWLVEWELCLVCFNSLSCLET